MEKAGGNTKSKEITADQLLWEADCPAMSKGLLHWVTFTLTYIVAKLKPYGPTSYLIPMHYNLKAWKVKNIDHVHEIV